MGPILGSSARAACACEASQRPLEAAVMTTGSTSLRTHSMERGGNLDMFVFVSKADLNNPALGYCVLLQIKATIRILEGRICTNH